MDAFARRRRAQTRRLDAPRVDPTRRLTAPIRAAPWTARLRWIALGLLLLGIIATVVVFGILQVRDNRRQHKINTAVHEADILLNFLDSAVGNLTAPPNCTLVVNTTITTNFSDAEFAVFLAGDMTARFQFNLTTLDPASLVTLTIQDASGTVAYLGDIPPIGSVFEDDVFTVQNAVDTSKQVMLDCSGISTSTTQLMTIQDASGTIVRDLPSGQISFMWFVPNTKRRLTSPISPRNLRSFWTTCLPSRTRPTTPRK